MIQRANERLHDEPEHAVDLDPLAPRSEDIEAEGESYRRAARPDLELVRAHVAAMQLLVSERPGGFRIARWELLQQAVEDRRLSPAAVRCLLALADYVNSAGFIAWPSYPELAMRLGCTADAVGKVIAELVATSYIVRSDTKKNGLRYSSASRRHFVGSRGACYAFGLRGFGSFADLIASRHSQSDDIESSELNRNRAPVQPAQGSGKGDVNPHRARVQRGPNRSPAQVDCREPERQAGQGNPVSYEHRERIEPKEDRAAGATAPPAMPAALIHAFTSYNLVARRCKLPVASKLDDKRRKSLAARLREYGADGWQRALAMIERSAFLQGRNDRGWRLDFDWLIGPANFGKVHDGRYGNGAHVASQAETARQHGRDDFEEQLRLAREQEEADMLARFGA